MGKRGDAIVAELQRLERKRKIATAIALLVLFVAGAVLFGVHVAWYVRVAVTVVAAIAVLACVVIAQQALNPFTMERATRARRTGAFTLKAEQKVEKLDDLFEVENVAAKTEEKRDATGGGGAASKRRP